MIVDYGFFNHDYPYTNFHELNLNWILRQMIELRSDMRNFVNQNTIKYADPIQWNITTQYEGNTVVIEPNSGNAYISSQPVPAGVAITNEDYWSVIGNFSALYESIKSSIAAADDGSNINATEARAEGSLLWLNSKLYKVLSDISVGALYITSGTGQNLEEVTIEELLDEDKDDIQNVKNDILNIQGDITIINSSILSIAGEVEALRIIDVTKHGVSTDAVDNTDAFNDIFTNHNTGIIYVPSGTYHITGNVNIPSNTHIIGQGDSVIQLDGDDNVIGDVLHVTGENIIIENLKVVSTSTLDYMNGYGITNDGVICKNITLLNCTAHGAKKSGFAIESSLPANNICLINCDADDCAISCASNCKSILIENCTGTALRIDAYVASNNDGQINIKGGRYNFVRLSNAPCINLNGVNVLYNSNISAIGIQLINGSTVTSALIANCTIQGFTQGILCGGLTNWRYLNLLANCLLDCTTGFEATGTPPTKNLVIGNMLGNLSLHGTTWNLANNDVNS